jgi:hypothetical protein
MSYPITHTFSVVHEDGSEETWSTNSHLRDALKELSERLRFIPYYRTVRHKASLDPEGHQLV